MSHSGDERDDASTDTGRELARYRAFALSGADWLWETDKEHRFTWVSDRSGQAQSIILEPFKGQTREQLQIGEYDHTGWARHRADLAARRPFRDFVYQRTDGQGTIVWVRTSGVPVFDSAGEFQGYRGLGLDITDEMAAKHLAELTNARLHEAVDAVDEGIALWDADDRLVLWNASYAKLTHATGDLLRSGISFEEFLREGVKRGYVLDIDEDVEAWIRHRLSVHHDAASSIVYRTRNDKWLLARERTTAEGGIVGTWSDVSALKRAQADGAQAYARAATLAAAIEELDDVFSLWDENDVLIMCNAAMRELNEPVLAQTVPGVPFETHLRAAVEAGLLPEAIGEEDAWIAARVEGRRKGPGVPVQQLRSNGRWFLVRDQKIGSATATTAVDITREKLIEQQTLQAQKLQAVGQLAGGIAHDFNNLLAIILGHAEVGERDVKDPRAAALHFEEIQLAVERAREVVQQLLTFSRGGGSEIQNFDLIAVVNETLALLRATIPTSIDLTFDAIDEASVRFGSAQLQQVLLNLCINARDSINGSGQIHLTVSQVHADGPCHSCGEAVAGKYISLSVRDNGAGMSPSVLGRMFDPFFTTKPSGSGSGMGLAMVHGLTHQHGGHIQVSTAPNQGTTVTVLLPQSDTEASLAVKSVEEPIKQPTPSGGYHIVVIDDEPSLLEVMNAIFEGAGFEVTRFDDPRQALEQLSEGLDAVDLVVTDQTMPGFSGLEVATRLLDIRPTLPIILCTGYTDDLDRNRVRELGVRACLQKPVNANVLIHLANALLGSVAFDQPS